MQHSAFNSLKRIFLIIKIITRRKSKGFKGFVRQHNPVTSGNTASAAEPGTELRALGFFYYF